MIEVESFETLTGCGVVRVPVPEFIKNGFTQLPTLFIAL
jgi:hypothetical protein